VSVCVCVRSPSLRSSPKRGCERQREAKKIRGVEQIAHVHTHTQMIRQTKRRRISKKKKKSGEDDRRKQTNKQKKHAAHEKPNGLRGGWGWGTQEYKDKQNRDGGAQVRKRATHQ
jgi:hypothetical protein